jgi:tetratricopeptide (TPR) repeat protein
LLPLVTLLPPLGCSIDRLFERDDPRVEAARAALEAGADADLDRAQQDLEEVLRFRCESDGGTDLVIERPNAAFDLGLVLFRIAELVGGRFGDEERIDAGGEEAESIVAARARGLDCAQLLLRKLAKDPATPLEIAQRARYLLGNFAFLARRYDDAIAHYDEVLVRTPARGTDPPGEAGPPVDDGALARDAAWNRAIALKRRDDQKDAGPDGGDDAAPESGPDADGGQDGGADADSAGQDGGDDGRNDGDDGRNDGGADGRDDAADRGDAGPPETGPDDAGPPQAPSAAPTTPPPAPSSSAAFDLRELDRFDQKAPFDPDFKARARERRRIPKGRDK